MEMANMATDILTPKDQSRQANSLFIVVFTEFSISFLRPKITDLARL